MKRDNQMGSVVVLLVALLCLQNISAQTASLETEKTQASSSGDNAKSLASSEGNEGNRRSRNDGSVEVLPLATTKDCPRGCTLCHEGHCFQCSNDYRRINYACEKRGCDDPKCMDCSSDVCYKCVEGYAPNLDGFCTWIGPSGCEDENCLVCSDTRIGCTECADGYQLRSNVCSKKACADKNCQRCSSDGKVCDLCAEGYQSRLGECLKNGCLDENCRQCSPSGGSCYRCRDGYHADSTDGICKVCPDPNCINCGGYRRSCLRCTIGFYVGKMSNGQVGCAECNKAISNCLLCSRNGEECYSCGDGYYLEHGHCIQCPANCAQCKSPWLCDQCTEGFNLYANGLCQATVNTTLVTNNAEKHLTTVVTILIGFVQLILFVVFI